LRLHGTSDRLLKRNKNVKTIEIEGGGYFMAIEKAKEIALYLNREIEK
tara:strand:- start:326 stop:469 length:144 start_codon:yes stop_codon:yes gene_type:complete